MNNKRLYKVQERFLFHAHIRIKLPISCENTLFDELFGIMEKVDRSYNSYSEGSHIDRINKHAGQFTEVDEETVDILSRIKTLSEFFEGMYDITVMPLIRLWGFYKNENIRIPSPQEIEDTLKYVDFRRIEIEGLRVKIEKGQEIITGSFIKSYAVDKVIERLKSEGVSDAIINAGGSTIAAINDSQHPYWNVNVEHPLDAKKHLFHLKMNNCCFSTSAQSKTFVEIGGKHYGHILNPTTGNPSTNFQTGVITSDCFIGDIVSTGLFNIEPKNFLNVTMKLSSHIALSAFMMGEKGDMVQTSNFEDYIYSNS